MQWSVGVSFSTKPTMVDLIKVQTDLDREGVETSLRLVGLGRLYSLNSFKKKSWFKNWSMRSWIYNSVVFEGVRGEFSTLLVGLGLPQRCEGYPHFCLIRLPLQKCQILATGFTSTRPSFRSFGKRVITGFFFFFFRTEHNFGSALWSHYLLCYLFV